MRISPVNAETIGSLGQDPGRCTIIVYNKFLQQIKIFKYLSGEIFLRKLKRYSTKTSKICSSIGNSNQHFQTKFGPKIFKKYKYVMHWFSPFFYMETKFVPSDKGIKTININRD
jgi:hypothetical protein